MMGFCASIWDLERILLCGKDIRVKFGLHFRVPFLGPSKEELDAGYPESPK